MAKSQKRYLVLLVFGLLVIIAAGVWMVFGRKTQIYEKTEEIFSVILYIEGNIPVHKKRRALYGKKRR